jgi:hypothetical protein
MEGMKTSLWGARLMALPSASGYLCAFVLRPSGGRHASGSSVRLLAAMLGDLGVSTLRSIKTMTQFSSLFGA